MEPIIYQIESTPKGIFEALTNGTWPSEDVLERAEQECLQRRIIQEREVV